MSQLEAKLNDLPKYIYDDNNVRLWLTITTDIYGNWNIGYSDTKGIYSHAIGENKTLEEAADRLKADLE